MVDCVKAVAVAVDSATTGMTHRLIKTSMFSISVQEANMGFDVFIDYMSSLEGNMEVHFLVYGLFCHCLSGQERCNHRHQFFKLGEDILLLGR